MTDSRAGKLGMVIDGRWPGRGIYHSPWISWAVCPPKPPEKGACRVTLKAISLAFDRVPKKLGSFHIDWLRIVKIVFRVSNYLHGHRMQRRYGRVFWIHNVQVGHFYLASNLAVRDYFFGWIVKMNLCKEIVSATILFHKSMRIQILAQVSLLIFIVG